MKSKKEVMDTYIKFQENIEKVHALKYPIDSDTCEFDLVCYLEFVIKKYPDLNILYSEDSKFLNEKCKKAIKLLNKIVWKHLKEFREIYYSNALSTYTLDRLSNMRSLKRSIDYVLSYPCLNTKLVGELSLLRIHIDTDIRYCKASLDIQSGITR